VLTLRRENNILSCLAVQKALLKDISQRRKEGAIANFIPDRPIRCLQALSQEGAFVVARRSKRKKNGRLGKKTVLHARPARVLSVSPSPMSDKAEGGGNRDGR